MPKWSPFSSPLRGSADEQFKKVSWGREPTQRIVVEARHMTTRQQLVSIGGKCRLRALYFRGDLILRPARPFPFLAFGARDNRLYPVGGSTATMARRHLWGPPGHVWIVERIDYESTKGNERVYFFHDHDGKRLPRLKIHRDGWPQFVGGSYRVEAGGIVG